MLVEASPRRTSDANDVCDRRLVVALRLDRGRHRGYQSFAVPGQTLVARLLHGAHGSESISPLSCSDRTACGPGWRLRRLALSFLARREVPPAADRLVVGKPLFAGGKLLLEPIKAAQPAPEVVDHVYERCLPRARDNRAAVLERAVVAEDDVQHRLLELGRKTVDPLDRPPHAVVAERDLALQTAMVRHRDRTAAD